MLPGHVLCQGDNCRLIGVGAIAAAIVSGFCEDVAQPPTVILPPRNTAIAADLAARYATVTVCPDNQAVLNAADVVILCLRPQDAAALAGLTFRSDLVIVSAMAGGKRCAEPTLRL